MSDTITLKRKSYDQYRFGRHEVVRFTEKETDWDSGMREGQRSASTMEDASTAQANMLILSTGYQDAFMFMRGFQEGFRIAKLREEAA